MQWNTEVTLQAKGNLTISETKNLNILTIYPISMIKSCLKCQGHTWFLPFLSVSIIHNIESEFVSTLSHGNIVIMKEYFANDLKWNQIISQCHKSIQGHLETVNFQCHRLISEEHNLFQLSK